MVFDSRIEKEGYDSVLDYRMSEKFGLDWRKYDHKRMTEFIHIIGFENDRQERDRKKQDQKSYGRQSSSSRHRPQG